MDDGVDLDPETSTHDKDHPQRFDDYCREIIISFGVIFAQEQRPRQQVSKQATGADWGAALGKDAILKILCTKRWQDHPLFDYLQSPPVRSNYSAQADFPFLGQLLLRLQAYMEAQSPKDFLTLIFDRRDPLRFWTFVLAIFLGGMSLILSLIQIAVGAAQLATQVGSR